MIVPFCFHKLTPMNVQGTKFFFGSHSAAGHRLHICYFSTFLCANLFNNQTWVTYVMQMTLLEEVDNSCEDNSKEHLNYKGSKSTDEA